MLILPSSFFSLIVGLYMIAEMSYQTSEKIHDYSASLSSDSYTPERYYRAEQKKDHPHHSSSSESSNESADMYTISSTNLAVIVLISVVSVAIVVGMIYLQVKSLLLSWRLRKMLLDPNPTSIEMGQTHYFVQQADNTTSCIEPQQPQASVQPAVMTSYAVPHPYAYPPSYPSHPPHPGMMSPPPMQAYYTQQPVFYYNPTPTMPQAPINNGQ
eukprot:TRINITY_DN1296_c0_g1_i2.p1 TRINITY_DN1296_c0_g1~~TRINITY_DN1296_c0_g1_i2.p1  ORF type:complete len:213 (+),score=52.24 TRINITY_DN1296_c0_g1_i2:246-884(+)